MNASNEVLISWSLGRTCNLSCVYCINKNNFENNPNVGWVKNDAFSSNGIVFDNILDFTAQNIKSVINSLEKLNKVCKISFTGGEPAIIPHFIELCQALTEKHYIRIDTNNCSRKVEEFSNKVSPAKVYAINTSFHIAEIEKRKLLKMFLNNIMALKKRGFYNTYATIVAYPEILNKIAFYKSILSEHVQVSVLPFYGYYNGKYYPDSYTENELKDYEINKEYLTIRKTKNKYCTAGSNYFFIDNSGRVIPCYKINHTLGNILYGFYAFPEPIKCPFDVCICNPEIIDPDLFRTVIDRFKESKEK